MTLRPHRSSSSSIAPLDYEIAQEQAAALGRAGRALEAALAALFDYDHGGGGRCAERTGLVQDASDALWRFVVQRESCGLRDQRVIIREYRVPAEVQNRMGIFGPSRRRPPA